MQVTILLFIIIVQLTGHIILSAPSNPTISILSLGAAGKMSTDQNGYNVYINVLTFPVNFRFSAQDSANTKYTVGYGDGVAFAECNDADSYVESTHTYTATGTYVVELYIDGTEVHASLNVSVLIALPSDLFDFSSSSSSIIVGQVVTLTVLRHTTLYTANTFELVTCSFKHSSQIIATLLDLGTIETSTTQFTANDNNTSSLGVNDYYFVCDNGISTISKTHQVTIAKRISDIKLTVSTTGSYTDITNNLIQWNFEINNQMDILVTSLYGAVGSYNYVIYWGDGTNTTIIKTPNSNFSTLHTYREESRYYPWVEVTDPIGIQNISLDIDPSFLSISGLYLWNFCKSCLQLDVLSPSYPVSFYTDDTDKSITYRLSIPPSTPPDRTPKHIICDWRLPNLTYRDPLMLTNTTLNYTLVKTFSYVYVPGIAPNQTVEVSCRSPIGSYMMQSYVYIKQAMTDITVTLLYGEGYYIITNRSTNLNVTVVGGHSMATLTMIYSDTSSVKACDRPIGSIQMQHTFKQSGKQYVIAIVTDEHSGLNVTKELYALPLIEDLTLYMNGLVQTPLILMYPNTTVNFSVISTSKLLMVTCNFDFNDSDTTVYKENMTAGWSGAIETLHSYEYVYGQSVKNVEINCSNPVSYEILNTTIEVYTPLKNISLSAKNTQFGQNTSFIIEGYGGDYLSRFILDFGNGVVDNFTEAFHRVREVLYMYPAPGYYYTNITGSDDYGVHFDVNHVLAVQKAINPFLVFDGTKSVLYPVNITGSYNVYMPVYPSDGIPPSEVNCTFRFPRYSHTVLVSNMINWFYTDNVTYTFDVEDGNNQVVQVFCFNLVDNFTSEITVHINRGLENLTLGASENQTAIIGSNIYVNCQDNTCYLPNNHVAFSISALYGDIPVTYFLQTIGGGTVSFPKIQDITRVVDLTTYLPGFTQLNISAEEPMFSTSHFAKFEFNLQLTLSVLSTQMIHGPTSIIAPNPMPVEFSLTLDSNGLHPAPVSLPPTNVTCVWSSPSGVGSSSVLSDEQHSMTITGNVIFDIANGISQTVTVNCSNKVSHNLLSKQVTLTRRINNVNFIVDSPWWGNHCETGVNCKLNITAKDGNHTLVYRIILRTGASSCTEQPELNNVQSCSAHSDWTYTKIFLEPATIEATLIINDTVGSLMYNMEIFVQRPLVSGDLVLDYLPFALYEDNGIALHSISLELIPGMKHPTNVSCDWTWANNSVSTMVMSTCNFTNKALEMHLNAATGLTKVISVTCSNAVSNMTKVATINLLPRVTPIYLEMDSQWGDYTATNMQTQFLIAANYGNYSVTSVLKPFSNATNINITQNQFMNHTITYDYNLPGVYRVGLSLIDMAGEIVVSPITVHVEQALGPIQVLVDLPTGVMYATWGPSGVALFWTVRNHISASNLPTRSISFTVTTTIAPGVLSNPTNVTCEWTHRAGPMTISVFTFENGLTANHMATFTEYPGYHTTSVNCSNHVSSYMDDVQYLVMERIAGLELTADKYIDGVNDIFTFTVKRTSGNNVTYVIEYKDSNSDTTYMGEDYNPATFTHSFSNQGHYNVTVTASNPAGDSVIEQISPIYFIDVQLIIRHLRLEAVTTSTSAISNPFQIPNGEAVLKVVPDTMYGIPQTVFFDWDFGDGQTLIGDNPPRTWTEHTHTQTYTTSSIGLVPVTVRAYNNISEQTDGLKINITIIQTITTVTVSSDLRYAKPDEVVTFSIDAATGSHIHYTITYGDGLSNSTMYDYSQLYQPQVLNRQQQFQHAYTSPGNYTVSVTATNHFSTDNAILIYDITVQYPVPELVVTGLTPVLTPPGLMSFEINRTDGLTFVPNDVTCNWTYNGKHEDSYYYFPNWNLPENISYHYNPNKWTITPTVMLNVYCSNEVTPIPKTTSMVIDIIDHLVVFGNLRNDGPGQYNESITWVLDVELYGHNPCFLWTFTNTSFKVLFGRQECRMLPQYVGSFDDFVLSTTTDKQLTYNTSFNIGPIVELTVEAENSISANDTESDLALVLEKPCDAPTASVGDEGRTPETARLMYYSVSTTVYGVSRTNCSYTHSFDVKWDVYRYDTTTPHVNGVFLKRTLMYKAAVYLKPDYTIHPRSLPFGTYYLQFTSTMWGLPIPIVKDDAMYLKVLPTPLITGIVGGIEKEVAALTGLKTMFDSYTLSVDPDLVDSENKVNMTWKWHCMKTALVTPSPLDNSYNWTNNTGFDASDCGSINAAFLSSGILEIDGGDLNAGQKYILTVYLSKPDGRSAIGTQIIKAKAEHVLNLMNKCTQNCNLWVNPDSILLLEGKCTSCSGNENITYTWKYDIKNSLNGIYSPVSIVPEPSILAKDGTTVLYQIPKHSLQQGYIYRVTLNGVLHPSGVKGSTIEEYRINKAPFGGMCEATVSQGTALLTQLSISCNNWADTEEEDIASGKIRRKIAALINAPNLEYQIQADMSYLNDIGNKLLSYGRTSTTAPTVMPLGDPNNNYSIPVYISIIDSMGTSAAALVNVKMLLPPVMNNYTYYLHLLELKKIANAGDIQSTVQYMWALQSLHELGGLQTTLDLTNEPAKKTALYEGEIDQQQFDSIEILVGTGYYILQLKKLKADFPNELLQIAELLIKLSSDTAALDVISDTKAGIEIVNKSMVPFDKFSTDMTDEEVLLLSKDMLGAAGNFLDLTSTNGNDMIDTKCNYTQCSDGIINSLIAQNKYLMEMVNNVLDITGKLLARNMMPGENATVLDLGKMVFMVQRIRPDSLHGFVMSSKYGSIELPLNDTVYDEITALCIDVNYAAFKTEPYVWSQTSKALNGPSQQAKVFDCSTKEFQYFTNTTYEDPYKINHIFQLKDMDWTLTQLNDTAKELAYHTFWMNDTTTYAQLYFDTADFRDMALELYVIFEDDPNINKYDFKEVLPRGMPDPIPQDQNERMEYIVNATSNFTNGPYTYVIPKKLTQRIGEYTVGVLAKAFGTDNNLLAKINYTFSVQYVSCKLWIETLNEWQDQDCEVTQETTRQKVKFKSKIFPSSFGAGILVGPNTINFGTVFDDGLQKLLDNIHVLVTIILFILIYLTLLPYARYKDRIDRLNWTPLPIVRFITNYKYLYEVEIYTGRFSKAGTTSNVSLTIAGMNGQTPLLEMKNHKRKNFKRGSMNKFTISSKVHMGKLMCVRVCHDNSGEGDNTDWFLEKIVVIDKFDDKRYLFLCDQWLSIFKGDFKLDRTLKLISKYQHIQFNKMFKRRAVTHTIEDNLWLSTLFRRDEDLFTRVQRCSAAIALVFLAMVASAMWYGKGDSETPKDAIQIGPISFTLQQLVVSIYAVLTVLPATLLILMLFTKSQRKSVKMAVKTQLSQSTLDIKTNEDQDNEENNMKENREVNNCDIKDDLGSNQDESREVNNCDIKDDLGSNHAESNDKNIIGPIKYNSYVNDDHVIIAVKQKNVSKKQKKLNFSGEFLPFWCVYIAHFLCFAAVILSGFFTILYSFEWGRTKSIAWLTSFLLSFVESEGFISPIKAVLLAVMISLLFKKPYDETDEYAEEYDDFVFFDDENEELAEEELEKIRHRKWLMNELVKAFKTLIWHALFLLCLALVTFGNRDPNSYLSNEELKHLYFEDAAEVSTQADFWDYLKDSALENLYLMEQYNGQAVKKGEKEFIVNFMSMRLGPPAVRQFRVKKEFCTVTKYIDAKCSLRYQSSTEQKADFLVKWKAPLVNYTFPASDQLGTQQAFVYDKGDATNFLYWGQFATYKGRGYAIPLGVSQLEAIGTVDKLIEERWLDEYTRAVVFEVNVYNANTNLFSLVTIIFEFPNFGSALVSYEIKTVKLYRYIGGMGLLALVTESIVILFIIGLIIRMIIHIVKQKKAFLTSVWNWMELLKLVCGFGSIAMYVLRTLRIQSTITEMMNNRGKLISFRTVTLVDEIFIYFIGFALFLQILQLLWVFKFSKSLGLVGATLRHSIPDLRGYFVVVFVIFMGFGVVHYVFYAPYLYNYRNFLQTSYTQLNTMLGAFRSQDIDFGSAVFGRILFASYTVTMVFLYINLLITILMDMYGAAAAGELDLGDAHKAVDLFTETLKNK